MNSDTPHSIIFSGGEVGNEMMKITHEGFYVRGERVSQGAGEAQAVYDAFVAWMLTNGIMR